MLLRRQQRGFNLVEMSIIVAIVGIIIGGVIVPIGSLMSDDIYERERERMAEIPRSIVGYAVTHQTTAHTVRIVGVANPLIVRTYTLMANRPYLPCPDVNGDGYEDRSNYGNLGIAVPNLPPLTITGYASSDNDLVKIGSCATQRGILPWRTLGLPAHDVWGNRYTYQVDGVFADALFGFNQNSIIDAFDPRLLATSYYNKRKNAAPYTISVAGESYAHQNEAAVICSGLNNHCINNNVSITLVAGKIAGNDYVTALRDYKAGEVMDGIPFVVVSHGKNGRGAINHFSNIANSSLGIRCNAPIYDTSSPFVVPLDFQQEASNTTFPHDTNGECPVLSIDGVLANASLPHFISRPRSLDSERGDFDDIVIWRTRRELVDALAGNVVLPAPDAPLLREY